jgi:hypothetical protein
MAASPPRLSPVNRGSANALVCGGIAGRAWRRKLPNSISRKPCAEAG